MNLWILRGETADKKAFEFLNAIRDHPPFSLDLNQIRKFDAPDFLLLRGQVILTDNSVSYEPFHQKPSADTLPAFLNIFLEGFEDDPLPQFTSPSLEPFKFCVRNTGQQTVRDFRTTLGIPQAFRSPSSRWGNLNKVGESTIRNSQYTFYETFTQSPIYGKDKVSIVELVLQADPGNYTFLWKIHCDDGTFPNEEDYGQVEVYLIPFGDVMDEAVENLYKKH